VGDGITPPPPAAVRRESTGDGRLLHAADGAENISKALAAQSRLLGNSARGREMKGNPTALSEAAALIAPAAAAHVKVNRGGLDAAKYSRKRRLSEQTRQLGLAAATGPAQPDDERQPLADIKLFLNSAGVCVFGEGAAGGG